MEFLARLGALALETATRLYAWCLIPNHFHLLLRSGAAPLSTLMRRLLTAYAVGFKTVATAVRDTSSRIGSSPSWSRRSPTFLSWCATFT